MHGSDGSAVFGRLSLPVYQRPYRWPLGQVARLLRELDAFASPAAGAGRTHDFYLGSITLHQEVADAEGPGRLNIIDGQQRLTTMALLAYCLDRPVPDLRYAAPESQARIRATLAWLRDTKLPSVDFARINVTLVITRSEDDAWRFFESQNTGGVRLGGADIIKAHHLRAVPRAEQNAHAHHWEAMGDLRSLVGLVMRARHWQTLDFRELASHRDNVRERNEIVEELAERSRGAEHDFAYRVVWRGADIGNCAQPDGYAMRQPLGSGANTILYLRYFHALRQQLIEKRSNPELAAFYDSYQSLAAGVNGSVHLRRLYDSALLLYVSQFGYATLHEAALWLFRAIFSPRLSNKKTVRESSAQAFAREQPVLDWIAVSHDHQQLMQYLQRFRYHVHPENLDAASKSIKSRFVDDILRHLGMAPLPADRAEAARTLDGALCTAIRLRAAASAVNGASQ